MSVKVGKTFLVSAEKHNMSLRSAGETKKLRPVGDRFLFSTTRFCVQLYFGNIKKGIGEVGRL